MKKILVFLVVGLFLQAPLVAEAQILKKVVKKAKKKTEREVEKKAEKEVGKVFEEKSEDSIPGQKQPKEKGKAQEPAVASQEPKLVWAKYDFVPGPDIIFDDNQENEENGEFPSRWDLVRGNAEVAEFGGDMVIMLRDGAPSIVPYFKDPQDDYLPDVFTIEFDLFYPGNGRFEAYLYDRKNQKSGSPTGYTYIEITHETMQLGQSRSKLPEENIKKSRWMHIAIAYTNGKLKAYMDETRLLNIPRIDFDPKGLTLYTYHAKNDNLFYVKNVRIAKGGVKYYDRIMEDGKIIANGIRFDVNKATLRPESMGVINEIHGLMTDHPEIKFSVEGHTDSDGEFDFNQELSERRANTVMMQLVAMGISADRLVSKGYGESKPMVTNDTPEGKAANRRVEFVKMSEEG
ncbi:OmpA family protein [Flavobacteriaceae bacterium TP-CH-4]|uniref:OmpA family protein n=1 Tax=Pelagihabitans pacificus TaxID=2696054 RepID=A0A967AV50_9FLAO|nr:OmpA family protein [Pelagihabitans pacificus]NHF59740.1 OmpA family protein [Pelagihabitans pacificus]